MRYHSVFSAILLATTIVGCAKDAVGPTRTVPVDAVADLAQVGRRGFGFGLVSQDAAWAVIDGTRHVRCTDSDTGHGLLQLTLTQRMIDLIAETLDGGGLVEIEVLTQHTFTGEGDYSYWETLTVSGPGLQGRHSGEARISGPGRPSVVVPMSFEEPITRSALAAMSAGATIQVAARARAEGDLGEQCGEIAGGQAAWRMRGAVLWLRM